MYVLVLECGQQEKDLLTAELWERGTLGVEEHEEPGGRCRLLAYFEEKFSSESLVAWGARWEEAEDRGWVQVSREAWEPCLVGKRLFLTPDWLSQPTPPGRLRLEVHPGMAAGTGQHPATQLCLEAMERFLRFGDDVLDVGTGSGILAQAAWLLGAGQVVACDIDTEAVKEAAANLERVGAPVLLFAGSARAVKAGSADLVVANLNAETLRTQAADIRRVLRAGGRAVLSGFQKRLDGAVREAMVGQGLRPEEPLEKEEWLCLVCSAEGDFQAEL